MKIKKYIFYGIILFFCAILGVKAEGKLTAITISPADKMLKVGQTLQYSYATSPEEYDDEVVISWGVSDDKIASVSDTGLVTGLASGTTDVIVTLTPEDGTVTINSALLRVYEASITLAASQNPIYVGSSISDRNGGKYESEIVSRDINTDITITITDEINIGDDKVTGEIKDGGLSINVPAGASIGSYPVTLTADLTIPSSENPEENVTIDTATLNFNLVVSQYVDVVSITANDLYYTIGDEVVLDYIVNSGTTAATNPEVAVVEYGDLFVEDGGKIYANSRGVAHLTLKSLDDETITDTFDVTIVGSAIDSSSATLVGNYDYDDENIYSSFGGTISFDIDDVNSVDIKVIYDEEEILTSGITASLDLENSKLNINVSENTLPGQYSIVVNGGYVVSSNTIDTITEFTETIRVYEYNAISSIEVNNMIVDKDDTQSLLDYSFNPNDATFKDVLFTVDDESVLTVSSTGVITPLKKGTTIVTITSLENSEKTADIEVEIIEPTFVLTNQDVVSTYDFDETRIYEGHAGSGVTAQLNSQDITNYYTLIKDENDDVVTDSFTISYGDEENPSLLSILTKANTPAGDYTATITAVYGTLDDHVGDAISNTISFTVEENVLVDEIVSSDLLIKDTFDGKLYYVISNSEEATNTNVVFEVDDTSVLTVAADGTITPTALGENEISKYTDVTIRSTDGSGVYKTITITVSKPILTYDIESIQGTYEEDIENIFDYYPGTITVSYDSVLVDVDIDSLVITESEDRVIDEDEFTITLDNENKEFVIETNTDTVPGTYTITLVGNSDGDFDGVFSGTSNEFIVYEASVITEIEADDMVLSANDVTGMYLSYNIVHKDAFDSSVTFTVTSGSDVIQVSDEGFVTVLKAGEAVVRIAAKVGGAYADASVKVVNVDDSYEIDSFVGRYDFSASFDSKLRLFEGYGGVITGHFVESEATDYEVVVKDSNGNKVDDELIIVSEVNNQREFTINFTNDVPVGTYTATFIASYIDGDFIVSEFADTIYEVEENKLISSIEADDLFITVGQLKTINYHINPTDATNPNLKFTVVPDGETPDPDITVNDYGIVGGVSEGTAQVLIEATDGSNISKTINVTVGTIDVDIALYSIVGNYEFDTKNIYNNRGGKVVICEGVIADDEIEPVYKVFNSADEDITSHLSVGREIINDEEKVVIKDTDGYLVAGRYKIVATLTSGETVVADTLDFVVKPEVLVTNIIAPDTIYIKSGEESKGFTYELVPEVVTNDGVHFDLKDGEEVITIDKDNLKVLVDNTKELVDTSFDIVSDDGNATKKVNVVFVTSEIDGEITDITGSYNANTEKILAGYGGEISGTLEYSDINNVKGSLIDSNDDEVTDGYELAFNDDYTEFYLTILDDLDAGDYTLSIIGEFMNGNEIVDSDCIDLDIAIDEEVLVSNILIDESVLTNGLVIAVDNTNTELEFTVKPDNVTNDKVSITVGDDQILYVDDDLKIHPLKAGETTITLTAVDKSGVSKDINVKIVESKITSVVTQVSGNNAELAGYILNGVGGDISGTYTTSDINGQYNVIITKGNEVVTTSFGEIVANATGFSVEIPDTIAEGNYNITITAGYFVGEDEISSDTIDIPFVVYPSDFVPEITAEDMNIPLGEETNIVYQPSSLLVSYDITDDTILTISETGVITPLKVGSTNVKIIAQNDEDINKTIKITVYESAVKDTDYEVENGYLLGASLDNDIEDFIESLNNEDCDVAVFDGETEKTSGKIGTGNTIVVSKNGVQVSSYQVVIMMDTNGDGEADALDYVRIKNHIMNKSALTGAYLLAANAYNDEEINAMDYVRVKNYIMNNGGRA